MAADAPPSSSAAHARHQAGLKAFRAGAYDRAVEHLAAAATLCPDRAEFHNDHGAALREAGRRPEALAAFRRALDRRRDYLDALVNLAVVLLDLGKVMETIAACRLATRLDAANVRVRLLHGKALEYLGRLDEATAEYLAAVRADPGHARAYAHLGGVLFKAGHAAEADLALVRALALDPGDAVAHSCRVAMLLYRGDNTPGEIFAAHREWDRRHARPLGPKPGMRVRHPNRRDSRRRLRVGLVSPNFYQHSVSQFLLPLLESHAAAGASEDPDQNWEPVCYHDAATHDAVTDRLRTAVGDRGWRDVHGESDEAMARRIRADGIDLLVDLAGHTSDHRLLVFARRPAPVQVTWLGYAHSTGLTAMDYRFTDDLADPYPAEGNGDGTSADALATETLVRLPDGFLCYGPPADAPAPTPLPAQTNPAGHVTFGSFNALQKITPLVVGLWAEVLHAVPGSRLLLKSPPDPVVSGRYLELFAAHGVAPGRVEFLERCHGQAEHLLAYGRVDVGLDPFPYHGTTTTCETLWMGVPVVTLAGDAHVSRVGVSLLSRVGLGDWVAPTPEDYIARAVRAAADLDGLAALRAGLRARMTASPLCDGPGFAHRLGAAFRDVWAHWCRGESAQTFSSSRRPGGR